MKIGLKEIECEVVDWIQLAQRRIQWLTVVKTVMNLRVSLKAGNYFPI